MNNLNDNLKVEARLFGLVVEGSDLLLLFLYFS